MKLIQSFITVMLLIFSMIYAKIGHSSAPIDGKEKVTQLIKQSLSDVPGQKAILLTVEFLPGQGAIPHKHPGSVIAYVLKGSITSQLEGQKPVTYQEGQYWYEPPNVGHVICKNDSKYETTRLIVWQLVKDDTPTLLPYNLKNATVQHSTH